MAHIQDRWYRKVTDPKDGKVRREKTALYGKGDRYKVRYLDPEGRERSKSFPDRKKKDADDFLIAVENDKREGKYVDPERARMGFVSFASQWVDSQTFDYTTRERISGRLRVHLYPFFEKKSLGAIKPGEVQAWLRELQDRAVSVNYRVLLFTHLASILNAAVDDRRILENPCHARSVTRPQVERRRIAVWSTSRASAVQDALPDRFKIAVPMGAGFGLRQGEIFGLSPDDLDREAEAVNVVRQVRLVGNQPVFAPPKRGKTRSAPLAGGLLRVLDTYMERFPPTTLTLPWLHPGGEPVTVRVIMVDQDGGACRRGAFNLRVWRPALARAGVESPTRDDGMHALRHLFASVLLDAGESVKAVAEYLGHSDPGFTLRVYTHLLASSHDRTRRAVDAFIGGLHPGDGLQAA
ncbi:tyrosine-type recombinase/integrase [Actinokineospora auranticolor]|uniref:Phage integrase family protein n=1 Tax=Actinokineospora auranticolor TaxID=155976 RepID=A0A2S6GYF7_9PSEU|nr:tyrosine-type recombinase/integrase [Actinokineospora auranticolor]PPK70265.1 phage integrase family protein [Actinokineospora auranticolor]